MKYCVILLAITIFSTVESRKPDVAMWVDKSKLYIEFTNFKKGDVIEINFLKGEGVKLPYQSKYTITKKFDKIELDISKFRDVLTGVEIYCEDNEFHYIGEMQKPIY